MSPATISLLISAGKYSIAFSIVSILICDI
jgi:hypothetical protein